jgi:hypothetical protein
VAEEGLTALKMIEKKPSLLLLLNAFLMELIEIELTVTEEEVEEEEEALTALNVYLYQIF